MNNLYKLDIKYNLYKLFIMSDIENEEILPDSKMSNEFITIIKDFVNDIWRTFNDKLELTDNYVLEMHKLIEKDDKDEITNMCQLGYDFCRTIYLKYFFDILYQSEEFFNKDKLELLPNVDFIELWKTDISDNTKSTIWKYLQLILFTVVTDIKTGESFGDTASLFEAINQEEFKEKIEATLKEMENIFQNENSDENVPLDLPKADDLHEHINKMLEGKIGCLAKEIAEETAGELDIDMHGASSVNDVFNKLFKNPSKLMDLVKNVGSKLDNKIKSGQIKETELLEEATEFVANMKNMPGMGNLESMFAKMGVPGMGKGAKVDMGALNRHMENNLKAAKMKDRMRNKLEKRQKEKSETNEEKKEESGATIKPKGINDFGMEELIYSLGEPVEKTTPSKKPRKKKKSKPSGISGKPSIVQIE